MAANGKKPLSSSGTEESGRRLINITFGRKTYAVLKAIALIWLPALGTLIFTIGDIWDIPLTAQIVGTIMAADTFIGVLLGISSKGYTPPTDGILHVDTRLRPVKDVYLLDFTSPLNDIPSKDHVIFKVSLENDDQVKDLRG